MAGGNNHKKPVTKRWTLRSPRGKPRTNTTRNIALDLQPALTEKSHRVSESSDRGNVQRQEHAQETPLTDQPDAEEARAWNRMVDTGAASRVNDERPLSAADAAARSAIRVCTSEKISVSRSPSPLSQPRRKSPMSMAGVMKRFGRSRLLGQGTIGGANCDVQQRLSAGGGAESSSMDTIGRHMKPPRKQMGEKKCESEQVLAAEGEKKEEGDEETAPLSVLLSKPRTMKLAGDAQGGLDSSSCQGSCCCEMGNPDQSMAQHVVAHPQPAAKHRTSREHTRLDAGADALKAIEAGQQRPRIAFVGVFLSGVAVVLASFVPYGGADARTALVKALLLEPSTAILPGSCYSARGPALAMHVVVDHKHRVYACVTAEDVPFSLALSLLEEVQIEYISTTSTLAFSTKENSHNKRCRAHMARSWAKYETVERTLARERETRRLLGEAPLDIECPLSRDNKTHTGAEVVPLHFNAQHQPALLEAELEISSLLQEGEERRCAGDIASCETSVSTGAASVIGRKRNRTTKTAAIVAAGVSVVLGASYAARRAYLSF